MATQMSPGLTEAVLDEIRKRPREEGDLVEDFTFTSSVLNEKLSPPAVPAPPKKAKKAHRPKKKVQPQPTPAQPEPQPDEDVEDLDPDNYKKPSKTDRRFASRIYPEFVKPYIKLNDSLPTASDEQLKELLIKSFEDQKVISKDPIGCPFQEIIDRELSGVCQSFTKDGLFILCKKGVTPCLLSADLVDLETMASKDGSYKVFKPGMREWIVMAIISMRADGDGICELLANYAYVKRTAGLMSGRTTLSESTTAIKTQRPIRIVCERAHNKTLAAEFLLDMYRPKTGALAWLVKDLYDTVSSIPAPEFKELKSKILQTSVFSTAMYAVYDYQNDGDWFPALLFAYACQHYHKMMVAAGLGQKVSNLGLMTYIDATYKVNDEIFIQKDEAKGVFIYHSTCTEPYQGAVIVEARTAVDRILNPPEPKTNPELEAQKTKIEAAIASATANLNALLEEYKQKLAQLN